MLFLRLNVYLAVHIYISGKPTMVEIDTTILVSTRLPAIVSLMVLIHIPTNIHVHSSSFYLTNYHFQPDLHISTFIV